MILKLRLTFWGMPTQKGCQGRCQWNELEKKRFPEINDSSIKRRNRWDWLFPLSFYLSDHLIFPYLKALFFRCLSSLSLACWQQQRAWNPYSVVVFRLNGKSQIGEIVVGHKDRLCPAILSFRHSKAFRDLKNISKGVLGAILHVLLCLKAGRLVKWTC
jgi:hypothetical protein